MSFASLSSLTGSKDLDSLLFLKLKKGDLLNAMLINKKCYFLIKLNKFWWNKLAYDFPNRSKFLVSDYHKNLYRNNPQKLYRKIDRKAIEIFISPDDDYSCNQKNKYNKIIRWFDSFNKEGVLTFDEKKKFAEILKRLDFTDINILYGDMVCLEMKNKICHDFIWCGGFFEVMERKKIEGAGEYSYDYVIPKYFSFPEFPLEHYSETNNLQTNIYLANLSEQTIVEIIKNFDIETQKSYFLDYDMKIFVKPVNKNKYTKNNL